jgi:hypothetical protein
VGSRRPTANEAVMLGPAVVSRYRQTSMASTMVALVGK